MSDAENQTVAEKVLQVYEQVIEKLDKVDQRVAALEKKLTSTQSTLLTVIKGPFTQMKADLAELKTVGVAPVRALARKGRQPLTRKDYHLIQQHLEDGKPKPGENWSSIARETGIPASTIRKYAEMTPEAADQLPPGD